MMRQNPSPDGGMQHTPRAAGRLALEDLVTRIPHTFIGGMGTRRFLLSIQRWTAFLPDQGAARTPWLPDSVHEEGRELVISDRAQEGDVDYYLGFLDALVAHYNERCFISVRTLRDELTFRCIFDT